jgi:MoxR-like ATPase
MAVDKPLKDELVVNKVCSIEDILAARELMNRIYVDDNVIEYAVNIVDATRNPEKYGLELKPFIRFGGSPRASLYLIVCARAKAFLRRRGFTTPEDVKAVAKDILRHRIILSYEAEAEELTTEMIIDEILRAVQVP